METDFDRDEFLRRLDNPAQPWVPDKPGDKVWGRVVDTGEVPSDFGGMAPTVTFECEDGEFRLVRGYADVLGKALRRTKFTVGDVGGVLYVGNKESKTRGTSYRDFNVVKAPRPGTASNGEAETEPTPISDADIDAGLMFDGDEPPDEQF